MYSEEEMDMIAKQWRILLMDTRKYPRNARHGIARAHFEKMCQAKASHKECDHHDGINLVMREMYILCFPIPNTPISQLTEMRITNETKKWAAETWNNALQIYRK